MVGRLTRQYRSMHSKTGQVRIEVEKDGDTDMLVSVVDNDKGSSEPAAAAIEFGHDTKSGKHVPGLHLITGGKG